MPDEDTTTRTVSRRSCEMAGCMSNDAHEFSACGIVYICNPCRALVEEIATWNRGSRG